MGDANGDGIPDILLPADGSVGIALGRGNGTFTGRGQNIPPFAVGVGGGAGQIFLENLYGQPSSAGLPDLVAPDGGGVTVLINRTK